jgi:hypothetical protein
MSNNEVTNISLNVNRLIPNITHTMTTLNNKYVSYDQESIENAIREIHEFIPVFFNEALDIGLDCLTNPAEVKLSFIPPYQNAMMTSHGLAVKFNDKNLPVQLITPIGSYEIKNHCDINKNRTQGYLADDLASKLKKDLDMYQCSTIEKAYAIGKDYSHMMPQMIEVGFGNIQCASGVFAQQEYYADLIKTMNKLKATNIDLTHNLSVTESNLGQLRNITNVTANQEIREENVNLKQENAILKKESSYYADYEHAFTSSSIDAISFYAGKVSAGAAYKILGNNKIKITKYTTPKIVLFAAGVQTVVHAGLHIADNIYDNADKIINGVALVGAVSLTFVFGHTIALSAFICSGILTYGMIGNKENPKPYQHDLYSKETAIELTSNFALNVLANGINKSPQVNHVKSLAALGNQEDVLGLTEVVRDTIHHTNDGTYAVIKNFAMRDFVEKSIPQPVVAAVVTSGTDIVFNKLAQKCGLFNNKSSAVNNNVPTPQAKNTAEKSPADTHSQTKANFESDICTLDDKPDDISLAGEGTSGADL